MNPSISSTSLLPGLQGLADPPQNMMDGPAMDYFVIELVNTLRESSAVALARSKKVEQEMIEAGLLPPPSALPTIVIDGKKNTARDSTSSLARSDKDSGKGVVDEEEEGVRMRLEAIGMHVGANIAERSEYYRNVVCRLLDVKLPLGYAMTVLSLLIHWTR